MKHLRDMRRTFPHLRDRSAIMGLTEENIPPHEKRRRELDELEAKKARKQAVPLRVAVLIRPELPPCYTCVTHAASTARVIDVLADVWAEFGEERLRRGAEIGPLPSFNVTDYCLCRYNAFESHPSLMLGDECPPRALVSRLVSKADSSAAAAASAASAAQRRGSTTLRGRMGSVSSASPISPLMDGTAAAIASFRPPAGLEGRRQSQSAAQTLTRVGTAHPEEISRDSPAVAPTAAISPPAGASSTTTAAVPAATINLASVESSHFAVVLKPLWLRTETLMSSERKTRNAIEGLFRESLDLMSSYEREKRSVAMGMQLQREEFADTRSVVAKEETKARDAIEEQWLAESEAYLEAFKTRYAALAAGMVAMYERMTRLRAEHRRVMEAAAKEAAARGAPPSAVSAAPAA